MSYNFAKNLFLYKGTKISPLASLEKCTFEDHIAIRPFSRLQRSKIGRCTSIGALAAIYDTNIGRFCSIARDAYIGGRNTP